MHDCFILKPKITLICFHSFSFVMPAVVIRFHLISFPGTCCYSLSLVAPFFVTCCHSVIRCTTRCHSLSLVVTRCHSLSLVVPLVVTRCTTRLNLANFGSLVIKVIQLFFVFRVDSYGIKLLLLLLLEFKLINKQ